MQNQIIGETTDATDAELVRRAKAGELDAFEVLTSRYEQRVYALAMRMLRGGGAWSRRRRQAAPAAGGRRVVEQAASYASARLSRISRMCSIRVGERLRCARSDASQPGTSARGTTEHAPVSSAPNAPGRALDVTTG